MLILSEHISLSVLHIMYYHSDSAPLEVFSARIEILNPSGMEFLRFTGNNSKHNVSG